MAFNIGGMLVFIGISMIIRYLFEPNTDALGRVFIGLFLVVVGGTVLITAALVGGHHG